MKRRFITVLAIGLIASVTGGSLRAADWGDLTGQFIYEGKSPAPEAIVPTKDPAVCGKGKLIDESLLVGAKGEIKNVIVHVYLASGDATPPIHADYAKTAKDDVVLDNNQCTFVPHVSLLRTSQTLVLKDSDGIGHNTKIDFFSNSPINPILPAKTELKLTGKITAAERLPATVSCSIHPWMSARLVVQDHPYMAVSGDDGKFTIKNLPAGKWTFQFYHEKAGYVQDVTVGGKKESWKRGRVELTIKKGANDLGQIVIPASAFAK